MKTQKAPLSIRIIYWLTNIALIMLSVAVIGVIWFNIASAFNLFHDDLQLHTQFPVKVDFKEIGTLTVEGANLDVAFVNATTKIHILNTPTHIANKIGLALLIVIPIIWYLTFIFRRFMVNVKNGQTFTISNIKILKHIAYGLVALWLLTLIYLRMMYYYIGKNVEFENISISNEFIDIDGVLIGAIFIWILAHIFETGLKLQQEKDLTI